MRFENQTFTSDVTLDYNEFIDCNFDNCVMHFGGGQFTITGTSGFRAVRFAFHDSAHRTLAFMKLIQQLPNGPELIREVLAGLPSIEPMKLNS